MDLSKLINIDRVALNVNISSKEELINFLLGLANKSGQIENIESLKNEILKRESVMSTGIGRGIAIPHAKSKFVKGIIGAVCVLKNPIDYDSIDNEKVQLCFLILGNESSIGEHLRILSKISRIMENDDLRQKLINSSSKQEFMKHFSDFC
jgi:PTS system fructose-specific IIC component